MTSNRPQLRAGSLTTPLVMALALVIALSGIPARAAPSTELSGAQSQLDAINAQIKAAESARTALVAQIADLLTRIGRNARAIGDLRRMIAGAELAVEALSVEVAARQAAVDRRAVEVYEQGVGSPLAFLLGAGSFGDFQDVLEYVSSLARGDQDMLTSLANRRNQLAAQQAELASTQAHLADTQVQLRGSADDLTAKLAEQSALIDSLKQAQAAAQRLVNDLSQPPPAPSGGGGPPPSGGGSSVQDLIARYFGPLGADQVDIAMCVAEHESGFNPDAQNPYSGAAGVYQFMPTVWPPVSQAAGWGGASVFDAEANVAVAAWAVGLYGWGMWSANSQLCGF